MALISVTIPAILSIILGIIILIWPKSLNLAIALYLIVVGILQLTANYF